MKSKVALGIIALFAFGGFTLAGNATVTHGRDQVVTGCLENGGSSGHYKLTGQDGATWKVTPGEYIDLSDYVGHTVTVAGPEARSHRTNSKAEEVLTVRDVAVDSQSCQQ